MSIVVLRKPESVLTGTTEQVVIGDSARVIDSLERDSDGVVQDITGWTASIIGHSADLPGVYFDVPGEIVSPASAGVFRWTHVGDFLTQIGEKSRARFTCQVRTVSAAGLVGYGAEFGLDFVVPETGEDTNMNAAAVTSIMDAKLRDTRYFNHWFPIPTTVSQTRGFRSAGFVDKYLGPARYVDLPAGNNKIFEVLEAFIVHPHMLAGPWRRPIKFTMTLNAANGVAPAGESCQGIELGSFQAFPPWNTTYATAVGGPVLQLRFNFTLAQWEVVVWDGQQDVPPDVYTCDIQPGFAVDLGITEAVIEYFPPVGATDGIFKAYLNGVLAKTVTGGRLNSLGTSDPYGAGYFVTNGSNAAAMGWVEAGFYGGRVEESLLPW